MPSFHNLVLVGLVAVGLVAAACQVSESNPEDDTQAAGATGGAGGAGGGGLTGPVRLRVAQFNLREMSTDKLMSASDEQATAAAEVAARFEPDILCINELQYDISGWPAQGMPGAAPGSPYGGYNVPGADNAKRVAERVAAAGGPSYEHTLLTAGNSGYYWEGNTLGFDWFILRGWGEYPGRFNTAVLSKYPIVEDQVRIITNFAWEDLPDNKIAQMDSEIGVQVPPGFPLFEKSLNVVPVQVGADVVHLVLLHPVSPAFDPINPYRNYDELRALRLFLDGQLPGVEPLAVGAKFIVVGDLNADPDDGDSLPGAIQQVLEQPDLLAVFPEGAGTKGNNGQYNTYISGCGLDDGSVVTNPAARFQLQLDYLLPSATIGQPLESNNFFPDIAQNQYDFALSCRASDHRFLSIDVEIGAGP
jgi:hypothetical protein